jgi:hypothetical protein
VTACGRDLRVRKLFVVCAVLTRRSWIAGWLVIPFVVAGCVIAFDLGHAVADAVGRA